MNSKKPALAKAKIVVSVKQSNRSSFSFAIVPP